MAKRVKLKSQMRKLSLSFLASDNSLSSDQNVVTSGQYS